MMSRNPRFCPHCGRRYEAEPSVRPRRLPPPPPAPPTETMTRGPRVPERPPARPSYRLGPGIVVPLLLLAALVVVMGLAAIYVFMRLP